MKRTETMTKKLFAVVGIIIAILMLFTACSATAATKPQPDEGAQTYEISGKCWAEINGDVIKVCGTSDIDEGTNGTLSVYSSIGKELALEKITQTKKGEVISKEFKIDAGWPDDVVVFLVFDTDQSDRQRDEIKAKYGDKFQNITGENTVWSSAGIAVVFQSDVYTVR